MNVKVVLKIVIIMKIMNIMMDAIKMIIKYIVIDAQQQFNIL